MTLVLLFYSSTETRILTVSPAEPRYYSYNFSDQEESGSVLVKIESDSVTCMTVSIQNTTVNIFKKNYF